MNWAGRKFRLRAVIEGVTFTDIVQFAANWELNSIPAASITVAVGREKGKTPATIHRELRSLLVPKAKAQVYMTVTDHGGEKLEYELKNQTIQIWEGSVSGSSWYRSNAEASYTINLSHWLEDLNHSSAISATMHPHNPMDFLHAACYPSLEVSGNGAGSGSGEPSWLALPDSAKYITSDSLKQDLWGEVLYKWLWTLADQDRADLQVVGGNGVRRRKNEAAQRALSRMKNTSKYAIKPAMDLHGADNNAITWGIHDALAKETASSFMQTTLWGKLVSEWAPSFFMAVVPRITDALVVPFVGALTEEFKTIKSEEYSHFARITQLAQPLQAVGIWHPCYMDCNTDGRTAEDGIPSFKRIAGWYCPKEDPEKPGVILIKEPPRWLCDPTSPPQHSRMSTDAVKENGVGHATDPGKGNGPAPKTTKPKEAIDSYPPLLDAYAKHLFVMEMLRGNTAELSGKLRFDIAPGSCVRIEGKGERFVEEDETAVPLYASVYRTTIVINSENQRAGTTFALAHVRTEAENGDPRCAIDKPPLYKEPWRGAALDDQF